MGDLITFLHSGLHGGKTGRVAKLPPQGLNDVSKIKAGHKFQILPEDGEGVPNIPSCLVLRVSRPGLGQTFQTCPSLIMFFEFLPSPLETS